MRRGEEYEKHLDLIESLLPSREILSAVTVILGLALFLANIVVNLSERGDNLCI
jgi:hypothetical protein